MDILANELASMRWILSPVTVAFLAAAVVLVLTGIPGRVILWCETEILVRRRRPAGGGATGRESGRMRS